MIRADCSHCGAKYQLPEKALGKAAQCKKCGDRFAVKPIAANKPVVKANRASKPNPKRRSKAQPEEEELQESPLLRQKRWREQHSPANTKERLEKMLRLLDEVEDFPRPRTSIMHWFVSTIVLLAMLTLPIIYLAFTAGVGWITYWHAMNDYVWMNVPGVRIKVFAALAYGFLILVGVVWFFSLFGVLFIRPEKHERETPLSRKEQPVLYAFADRLAELVGAPKPVAIYLDMDVNASASFESSFFGLWRKHFSLTLGIPLVASMTLEQLAGIMAHEFGHFSQRGSSFQQRFIGTINNWFMLAVYRRGNVDAMMDTMADESDDSALLGLMAFVTYITVGLGRAVLWCLMFVGLFLSASLLRRQEFDADRYEINLVGTETFVDSSKKLVSLSVAFALASQHVFGSRSGDHLPKNFAQFVAGLEKKSKTAKSKAAKLIKRQEYDLFSSHPTVMSRINAARKQDKPGVFHSKLSAAVLVKSFKPKCSGLTRLTYSHHFGRHFTPETMRTADEVVQTFLNTREGTRS